MKSSKPLLDVLNGGKPERRPIWLMRQAGRYLPEYRELRAKAGSFLDLCYHPGMAAEVTLQPLRRFDLDAAILFSDILVVPQAMGLKLDFVENEGPVLDTVNSADDVMRLKVSGEFPAFLSVAETVSLVGKGLAGGKTLIGFCGAPWTVASYMIEGGSSDRAKARAVAASHVQWFDDLIAKLVDVSVHYLDLQVKAGAEVLQIFDSWAGDLPLDDQLRYVDKPIAEMRARLKAMHPSVPVIVFARGVGKRHGDIARATHASAVGVEQDVSIAEVLRGLPDGVAVQGNLDPSLLLGPRPVMIDQILRILGEVPMQRHVFNLGHGINKETSPETVEVLVNTIRKFDGTPHV